jgi:hypothetical protein
MKDNFFTENLRQSSGMRVFIFAIIFLVCTLLGAAVAAVMASGGDLMLKLAQGISSILMFVVPPIVYYYITRRDHPMQQLGFREVASPAGLLLITSVLLMFISLPVTNQLTTWNEALKLGGPFEKLETLMKNLEDKAAAVTERMLNVDTIGGLLLNLIVIALIPAVGEELTFRGVLQQALTRKMKNPHVAIILSAAIFSFIHFQFYGFLPRMFLGILLGYMFYITGSLWTSMLMHFLNNGTAVVLYYLNNKGIIDIDVNHFGAMNGWMVALSAALTVALIVWSWWKAKAER